MLCRQPPLIAARCRPTARRLRFANDAFHIALPNVLPSPAMNSRRFIIQSPRRHSARSTAAPSDRAPWRGLEAIHFSEIRPVRRRHRGVPSGIIFMPVFGADIFRPFAQGTPISYSRRPRHREGALILDRELELQSLTLIVGVDSPLGDAAVLFFAPFLRFFRGFVIQQPRPAFRP